MTTVFVTAHTPTRATGRGLRVYGLVRALAMQGDVHLVYVVFGGNVPDPAFRRPGVHLHPVVPSRGLRRAVAFARSRAGGVPASFARGVSPELRVRAAAFARELEPARLVADGPIAAATLLPVARRRPVIYNAHNIESDLRAAMVGDAGSSETFVTFERRVLETFDETWVVSQADLARASELAPAARLRYVPNVIDVASIAPALPAGRSRVLFAGDFSYPPNRDAFQFLEAEILPALRRRAPDARLVVTGRGSTSLPAADNVELLGFVDDLDVVYRSVDCVLVPLRIGGGSPLKFVEAMAYGLPVVATPVAARGLAAVPGEHFLLGDDPESLAELTAECLADEKNDLRRAARKLAENQYSIETLGRLLSE